MLEHALEKFGFFVGILIFFSEGINYAQHAPFFPNMAQGKGSSVTWVGFISGSFDISAIILSIILPLITDPGICSRFVFILGSCSAGVACICFAFTELVSNTWLFNFTCLFIRTILGAASCLMWGFGVPLFSAIRPEDTAMVIGAIEMAYASGLMVGPAFGSLLFFFGGFKLPFIASGLFEIVLTTLCLLFLPKPFCDEEKDDRELLESKTVGRNRTCDDKRNPESPQKAKNNFIRFITRPGIVLNSLPHVISCCAVGYIDVAISPYLLQVFEISGENSGYVFLAYGVTYAFACPLVSSLVSKGYASYLYATSPFLTCVTFVILFVPVYIPQLVQLPILVTHLGVLGVLLAMTAVPFFLVAEKSADKYGFTDSKVVKVFTANHWNLLFFSGRLLGAAFVGGFTLDNLGFYWTNFSIAALTFIATLTTLATLTRMELLKPIFYSTT